MRHIQRYQVQVRDALDSDYWKNNWRTHSTWDKLGDALDQAELVHGRVVVYLDNGKILQPFVCSYDGNTLTVMAEDIDHAQTLASYHWQPNNGFLDCSAIDCVPYFK